MASDLVNYARKCLRAGYKVKDLKNELLAAGWPSHQVEQAVGDVLKEISQATGVMESTLILKLDDKSIQIYSHFLDAKTLRLEGIQPGKPPRPSFPDQRPSARDFVNQQKSEARLPQVSDDDLMAETVLLENSELPQSEPSLTETQILTQSSPSFRSSSPSQSQSLPQEQAATLSREAPRRDLRQVNQASKRNRSAVVIPLAFVIVLALLMDENFLPKKTSPSEINPDSKQEVIPVLDEESRYTEIPDPVEVESYEEYTESVLSLKIERDSQYFTDEVIRPCHPSFGGVRSKGQVVYISERVPVTISGESQCMDEISKLTQLWNSGQLQFKGVYSSEFSMQRGESVASMKSRTVAGMEKIFADRKMAAPQVLAVGNCPCVVLSGTKDQVQQAWDILSSFGQ